MSQNHCATCKCNLKWTPFQAKDGNWLLVRLDKSGNSQAYSLDGRNAVWSKRKEDLPVVNPDTFCQPLTCGQHHASVWNATGYESPSHWCSGSYTFLTGKPPPTLSSSNNQQQIVAPYVMPNGDIITRAMTTIPQLKFVTLAFANVTPGGQPYWDCGDPRPSDIEALKKRGGNVVVATGGQAGCASQAEPGIRSQDPQQIFKWYCQILDNVGTSFLDLDIEGGWETKQYEARHKALQLLQNARPNLILSFTLPADTNGIAGTNMLKDAVAKGIRIDTVRLMVMDFGRPLNLAQASKDTLSKSRAQLDSMGLGGTKLGYCPLVEMDDQNINYQSAAITRDVVTFIRQQKSLNVGTLTYWELGRDSQTQFSHLKQYF